jgi:hypothetical protein
VRGNIRVRRSSHYSTCSAELYGTVRYSTVHVVQNCTVRYSTVQYSGPYILLYSHLLQPEGLIVLLNPLGALEEEKRRERNGIKVSRVGQRG